MASVSTRRRHGVVPCPVCGEIIAPEGLAELGERGLNGTADYPDHPDWEDARFAQMKRVADERAAARAAKP